MDFNAEKEPSWFPEAKVYHNGSHFIAIPHTKVRRKKRGKPKEEIFVVSEGDPVDKKASVLPKLEEIDSDLDEELECPFQDEIEAYYEQVKQVKMDVNADMVPLNEGKSPKIKLIVLSSKSPVE